MGGNEQTYETICTTSYGSGNIGPVEGGYEVQTCTTTCKDNQDACEMDMVMYYH